jgi:hypothetical protein
MPLDATVGGPSSNSYLTRAAAAEYFERRLRTSARDGADGTDQDLALMTAASRLDQEEFEGYRSTNEQAMKFPRSGTTDADGRTYASDAIPQPVKDAQCELALLLLETDALKQSRLSNFTSLKIGPLEIVPKQPQSNGSLPAQVVRLLAHLLASSPGTIRMVRG